MKKQIWIISALLWLSFTGFSQEKRMRFQDNMASMQAERVSFLTSKLQLTVEEAEKFWPVYNEYLKKREEQFVGRHKVMPRNFDMDQASDQELERMLNDILDQDVILAELKKEYFNNIRGILPVKKVLLLHRAEQDFMNHMLNKLRQGDRPENEKRPGREPFRNLPG